MAEKAVLVDKLPPVKAKQAPVAPARAPEPEPVQAGEYTAVLSGDAATLNTATAHTEEPAPGDVTITGFDKLTYQTFLLDLVAFGLMGVFFVAQAMRRRATVHFGAMIGFGAFLFVLAASFFLAKMRFADFLWGGSDTYNLLVRGVCWTILAPFLFVMLSRLIHVAKKDLPVYVVMFGMAAGLFFFIALSNFGSMPQGFQLVFALGSFTCSASLIVMLFFTLGSLPEEDVPENLRRGVTIIVLVIACGWFLYPFLNLLSRFLPSSSLYPFLLNLVDLVTVGLIAYGFYQGAGRKAARIVMKPAFRKARIAPSTMDVQEIIEDEEPVPQEAAAYAGEPEAEIAEEQAREDAADAAARPKPTFRRPAKRMKDPDES
jgi:hypothetical protein